MKYAIALIAALFATTATASPPINCPGNSCGASPNSPTPISVTPTSTIPYQVNAAPITSVIKDVTIRATIRPRTDVSISGVTISATAVGNSSVVIVRRE